MSTDHTVETIPAARLVGRRATLDPASLGRHIEPMFEAVAAALRDRPGSLRTPVATYARTDAGVAVVVGYVHDGEPPAGTERVDLPEVQAVCGIHHGPVAGIDTSWRALHRWVTEHGYTFAGPCREVYREARSEDQSDWVTELQQPVTR